MMPNAATQELNFIFCGTSRMAQAMRAHDWDNSCLGPVKDWPDSLKASIRIMLVSAYPMALLWGKDMITFYNDGYIPVLGAKHPEALGKPAKINWSEIWDVVGAPLENVIRKKETSFAEKNLLYMERSGFKEETYYTYSYSPVFNGTGTVEGILCVSFEETSQVLNERRLKTISKISSVRTDISINASRNEVLKVLSENTNDLPFYILYEVNDDKPALYNYSKSAFKDKLEGGYPELIKLLAHGSENTTIRTVDIPPALKDLLVEPDHGMLPEQAVVVPVKEVGQNLLRGYLILGISAVLPFDDTYQKFINLLSAQVNALVTSVWAFEHERMLSKKLIELDKAKTNFFHNVSHEFRTPLTLILGPLEVLLSKSDNFSAEDRSNLQLMYRNSVRLLKQVNNLLNFSYVESGRYNVRYVPTDLSRLTEELASTFSSLMEQADIEYSVKIGAVSEPVFVDAAMWEVVVLNLLSNAYKFTPLGKVEIALIEQKESVELHVKDSGIGIPQQELPKIFEKFHRVEQSNGRAIEGSGIGLALVAELVKLHKGTINVSSEEGRGSEFIITIPKGKDHLPQDSIKLEADNSRESLTGKLRYSSEAETWLANKLDELQVAEESAKPNTSSNPLVQDRPLVLLVDDNEDMLDYVTRLLQEDYHVLTAGNGQEALDLLQRHTPDLILSDVMMPVMDGVKLLKTLRAIPAFVTIPVILLSARAGDEDKFYGLSIGADDYLVKPFSAKELLARVNSTIKNTRLRNELKEREVKLLKEAEQRKELLESILNSISDAFYKISPELEFIYVNNKAVEISKKTREEHIGRKILDVYPYLAGSDVYQVILNVVSTMQPATLEYYDEELHRWFYCRLYPSESGTTGYFSDITDRKLEEQARLETEKRFHEMANAAPVLIWMSGTDMLCDFFNEKWLEFRGRTLEEEYGNGWVDGVHPDDVERCMATYIGAFKAGQSFSMEYRLQNKYGEYRWVLDNGVPRITNDGELLGYIGACTDITELKLAEELLSKYNSELEKSVAERTTELQEANEQLKIEIEEKIRKKRELIKSHEQLHLLTSHLQDLREHERKLIASEIHDELGQALTAFKIEISLLYDRVVDSRSKFKNGILESLGSMEQAVDASLLSLRKIISHLRPSLSDDLELVYEIQRLIADLEKRIGIPIVVRSSVNSVELPPNIAIEVYRVIQESVTNIIKHAQATSASIEILKESDNFKFIVSDNGVGFDEQLLSEKQSFGILGIKERAQRIGAELNINSAKGKGTTVELLIDATLENMN